MMAASMTRVGFTAGGSLPSQASCSGRSTSHSSLSSSRAMGGHGLLLAAGLGLGGAPRAARSSWRGRGGFVVRADKKDDDEQKGEWEDWLGDRRVSGKGVDWEDQLLPIRANKEGGVPRDRWLKSEPDFFQKFDPNTEERESALRMEVRVNKWETERAITYVGYLVVVPLIVATIVKNYVAAPILIRWEGLRPDAFVLTDEQKVDLAKEVHEEEMRLTFESSIGKEELHLRLQKDAKELKVEGMKHNREAVENVFSDSSAGLTIFSILVTNRSIVVVLRRTLDRVFMGLSDTGKAFIIILFTDVLLGFHSEAGWQTVLNMGAEHYGVHADHAATTLFISTVPVTMDAIFKFWVFRYLNRISPTAAVTFRTMNGR